MNARFRYGSVRMWIVVAGVQEAPRRRNIQEVSVMSDRQGRDTEPEAEQELSFELREMLHMLGRIESSDSPESDAEPDVTEELDLDAFAL